ncbi:MAG: type II toxin-antitoxin system HicB family antitoxin [Syntrophobacterales bacterium]|nr:type II toxin-antitoxin system HicB family antitoxin [Syntrophobacterales bacterium]
MIIESQPEGGFTAYAPALPGCVSENETYQEALDNIRDAVELYLEVRRERGGKITPDTTHITEVCVSL